MPNESKETLEVPEDVKKPKSRSAAQKFTLEEFADVISKADPDAKRKFAKSLGLVQAVSSTPKKKQTNEDVKRMMLAFGDVSHGDDFTPTPPEWVMDRDNETPGFAQAWIDKWRQADNGSINSRTSVGDAEMLAANAVQSMDFDNAVMV